MLWCLHLCSVNGIVVIAYTDETKSTITEDAFDGRFAGIALFPRVKLAGGRQDKS
jgi:hypothetical protein